MFKSKIFLSLFIFSILLLSFSISGVNSSLNLNNNYENVLFSSFYGHGNDVDTIYSVKVDANGYIYILSDMYTSYFQTVVSKFTPHFQKQVFQKVLGGTSSTEPSALTIDSEGNIYVTGFTWSTDFPLVHAFQTTNNGQGDAFLTKFSNNGTILFSTLIGGSGQEIPGAIALDNNGNVVIAGQSSSSNYPLKNNSVSNSNFNKIFVSQFSNNGSLIFSSTYGGVNQGTVNDMVIDKNNVCYLAGREDGSFQTNNSYGSGGTYYASVLALSLSSYKINTSILIGGGPGNSEAFGIALDKSGRIIITGKTQNTDFPLMNPLRNISEGGWEGFVSAFSPNGSNLLFSSYLGGNNTDFGRKVLVNGNDDILLTGFTSSSDFMNFGELNNNSVNSDIYFMILNNNFTINYERTIGGSGNDQVTDMIMSSDGSLYFTGITFSSDFPLVNAYKSYIDGNSDGFIFELSITVNESITLTTNPNQPSTSLSQPTTSTATNHITATPGNDFSVVFISFLIIDIFLVLKKRRKY